ncbi:MAG: YceI family protein [Candidatus Peribacteraceae bacterium]
MKLPALLTLAALSLTACQTTTQPVAPEDMPTPSIEEGSAESLAPTAETSFTGNTFAPDYDDSTLSFVGESSIVNHAGVFKDFTFELTLDSRTPSDLTKASLVVTADVTSVETDSEGLDSHLQKEDFFDTATYSNATFTSTSIVQKTGDYYTITGDMNAKGVTKQLSMDALITDYGFSSSFNFPRKEFGVGNDSYGDKLLRENVPVLLEVLFE